ncbi:MAG TPA: methyl-accepting chemotaxis protein [Symbiobacteriaceae bacterium]|nr:methyl-accepting chemotaxis protein [Symbiobacteriaceae bacterium]
MRRLHNATLGQKLSLISGTAVMLLLIMGFGGVFAVRLMNQEAGTLIRQKLRPAQSLGEMRASVLALGDTYKTMREEGERMSVSSQRANATLNEQSFDNQMKGLQQAGFTGAEKEALDLLVAAWTDYKKYQTELWQGIEKDGTGGVFARIYGDIDTTLARSEGILRRMSASAQNGVAEAEGTLNQAASLTLYIGSAAVLLGAAWLLLIARAVRTSLLGPVKELTTLAETMGSGDLRQTVENTDRRDEIGRLHNSIARMSRQMRGLLESVTRSGVAVSESAKTTLESLDQVNEAARQLAEAIGRVAAGAGGQNSAVRDAVEVMGQLQAAIEQVARGAQEQAEHMSESSRVTAAAGESVQEMARNVSRLAAGADEARTVAESGITTVQKAVQSMQRLQARVERTAEAAAALERESKQIRQAVTIIEEMADQTNLLALNAAIEAARAGDAGKGFAVVAEAVRSLAERSGKAAKEIADLIHSVEGRTVSVASAMQEGSQEARASGALADDAGKALRRIVETVHATVADIDGLQQAAEAMSQASASSVRSADHIAAVVEENTATTEEMAASSEQVQSSIRSIAEVAEETAATAEEVSASVEELSATTEHVATVARNLVEVSEQLRKQVEKFRV